MPGMLRVETTGNASCTKCKVAVELIGGTVFNFTCTKASGANPWVLLTTLNAGQYEVRSLCLTSPTPACTNANPSGTVQITNGQTAVVRLTMLRNGSPCRPMGTLCLRIKGNKQCKGVTVCLHSPPIPTTDGSSRGPHETEVYGPYELTKEPGEEFWTFPADLMFPNGAYRAVALCATDPSLCHQAPMACFGDIVVIAGPHPPCKELDITVPQKGKRGE